MFAYYVVDDMDNTKANARIEVDVMENQEVPPQGNKVPPQVPNALQVGNFTLEEFRTSMNLLSKALTAQANREVVKTPIWE